MSKDVGLGNDDYPGLYAAADAASLRAQTNFLRGTKTRLAALLIAGFAGAFTWTINGPPDWAGVIATSAFALALTVEVYLLKGKQESIWYEGRAVAESVKTLAWRYAVGGDPFPVDEKDDGETDRAFVERLRQILTDLEPLDVGPPPGAGQITNAMRRVRSSSLTVRIAAYEHGRIDDQQTWYSKKAKWNQVMGSRWSVGLLIIEGLGFLGALGKAIGLVNFDLLGVAGILAAAGAAWLQTKQHRTLARAYSVAAHELSMIKSQLPSVSSEAEWAKFMNEAEEAISREHTLWRASRGVRKKA